MIRLRRVLPLGRWVYCADCTPSCSQNTVCDTAHVQLSHDSHDGGDDEAPRGPDEADGEHGEADVLGLVEVTPDMSSHVAVDSAETHKEEVEALDPEELRHVDRADSNVSVEWIDVKQSVVTEIVQIWN